jgi:hypothetical protein
MNWLGYISSLSILFPFAAALYRFPLLNKELKIMGWLFIVSTVIEIVSFATSYYRVNNLWLINSYNIIEGFIFFYICGRWFQSQKIFRAVMILFAVYAGFWFYTTFISAGFFEFNEKEKTLKGILLILITGSLLLRISKEDTVFISQDYRFWFVAAILIYFSVGVVIFSTANLILEDNIKAMYYSWNVHSVINIICNLLFAYGFTWYYQKVSSYI